MTLLRPLHLFLLSGLMLGSACAAWGENSFTQTAKDNIVTTWKQGRLELIVPANTWHNRASYNREQIDSYNERPWGAGLAKTYTDERDNRHRLLALVFLDSFKQPEPTMGYSWQAVWWADHTVRPTLGFVAGITLRDSYDWIPIPAVIPVVGIDIGPFSAETTYLIGFDVLFSWVTLRF